MKGHQIIQAVMDLHKVGASEFFTSKIREHIRVRRIAILRLWDAGLTKNEIAYVMRRDHTTIGYWVRPEMRERKKSARFRNDTRKTQELSLRV